jgi:hypothetical protein
MGKVEQPERNLDGSYTHVPQSKLTDILQVSSIFAVGLLGVTFMMIRMFKLIF